MFLSTAAFFWHCKPTRKRKRRGQCVYGENGIQYDFFADDAGRGYRELLVVRHDARCPFL
jgi:hypothetical protein